MTHKTQAIMNAFAILALVLPLPFVFAIHDAEEIAFFHRWMVRNRANLEQRFPSMKGIINHLAMLNTKAFAIAAAEELLVLLAATAYVLADAPYCKEVWMAIFIAFAIHLIVHLAQALVLRAYVPGVATSLLILPYAAYGIYCISLAATIAQMIVLGIAGCAFVIANMLFAHQLALRLSKPTQ